MALILPTGGTYEKTERGFFSSSYAQQKPLSILKIRLRLPKSFPEIDWSKLAKNGFLVFLGERFCRGKWFWSDPP
jgi:hypothetical protein